MKPPKPKRFAGRSCLPSLRETQESLSRVFTHPKGVESGLVSAGFHHVQNPVTTMVTDRPPVPLHTRLAVYSDAYFLRLSGCLGQDFAAVRRVLGEIPFQQLAADYLRSRPSRSPFINDIGSDFSSFLQSHSFSRPLPYLSELAALEWNILRSLFATRLPSEPFENLGPEARLRLDPTVHVMETRWPVDRLWRNRGNPPQEGARRLRRPSVRRLLIHRDDTWVKLRLLKPPEFLVLSRIQEGRPLGEALEGIPLAPAAVQLFFFNLRRRGVLKGVRRDA